MDKFNIFIKFLPSGASTKTSREGVLCQSGHKNFVEQ